MIRRPPRSTLSSSSAASDVYKRQVLVESVVGLSDQEVLRAISSHTLGRIGMSPLEKIIFLADMIEPGREFPGIEKLRRMAEQDLDQAMVLGINATLAYCLKKGSPIHSRTVQVRNYLLASLPAEPDL